MRRRTDETPSPRQRRARSSSTSQTRGDRPFNTEDANSRLQKDPAVDHELEISPHEPGVYAPCIAEIDSAGRSRRGPQRGYDTQSATAPARSGHAERRAHPDLGLEAAQRRRRRHDGK
jgi:hypothetical protein